MNLKKSLFTTFVLLINLSVIGQIDENGFENFSFEKFEKEKWVLPSNYSIDKYKDTIGIMMYMGSIAYLKDYGFTNGIIELDLASPVEKSNPSYLGLIFRLQDIDGEIRGELVYFRPHLSDGIHAVQYLPIHHGTVNWPDFEAPVYGAKTKIPSQKWFHVKIVIEEASANIYINGILIKEINGLARGYSSGSVGLWLGASERAYFSNFKIKKMPKVFN